MDLLATSKAPFFVMARADLIVRLVRSASRGEQAAFRRVVEALVAEERAKQHHVFASRLEESLQVNGARPSNGAMQHQLGSSNRQVVDIDPQRHLESLVLPPTVRQAARELVEEQHRSELLHSYGLEPRHRVLLVGPPGNGKTSLAEALATELMVPFYVVSYEAVVASYLGETSSRLQQLFDFVRNRRCVLFFDEFDTLGKERGDEHETGEIKRVVSNLLLQIDRLPSFVVVVTATNHPELLDRAVWRRFQLRLELPAPDTKAIEEWLERFQRSRGWKLGRPTAAVAQEFKGASFSEIEELIVDVQRRVVLAAPEGSPASIFRERLSHWKERYAPPDSIRPEG